MAKATAVSSPLLRVTSADCESDSEVPVCDAKVPIEAEANGSSKCHKMTETSNRATPASKPCKKKGFLLKRYPGSVKLRRKKSLKSNQVMINIRDSDSHNDNDACRETVIENDAQEKEKLNESKNKKNSSQREEIIKKLEKEILDKTPKHSKSEYDEKLTPIGRVLFPVRREGESGCGFNSLFISPDDHLRLALNTNRDSCMGERIKGWFRPSASAVNMKIFGGVRGVMKEQNRMLKTNLIIHPYSTFRYVDLYY